MSANDHKRIVKTAILVDGGFYRKRAKYYVGEKSPKERADELFKYCLSLLFDEHEHRELYRIFYYDCPPIKKTVFNPLTKKTENMEKTPEYEWTKSFYNELKTKRKIALRLGRLSEDVHYDLKAESFKKLMNGSISLDELTESDISLSLKQKGVDMRIGVDISSLAFKKQVDQIILVAGDSDFVPAAKQARREGIDFILCPMGNHIKDDLFEHIDGITSRKPFRGDRSDKPERNECYKMNI